MEGVPGGQGFEHGTFLYSFHFAITRVPRPNFLIMLRTILSGPFGESLRHQVQLNAALKRGVI